jgi:hypothetical protein
MGGFMLLFTAGLAVVQVRSSLLSTSATPSDTPPGLPLLPFSQIIRCDQQSQSHKMQEPCRSLPLLYINLEWGAPLLCWDDRSHCESNTIIHCIQPPSSTEFPPPLPPRAPRDTPILSIGDSRSRSGISRGGSDLANIADCCGALWVPDFGGILPMYDHCIPASGDLFTAWRVPVSES